MLSSPISLPEGGMDIDGSQLEGGGQILRNAAALAAIQGLSIRVQRIRAGRPKAGLRPQHLSGLQLVTALSGGELEGGAVKSQMVSLVPGRLLAGDYTADTSTAGSCMLLAQVALPCLFFAGSSTERRDSLPNAQQQQQQKAGSRSQLQLKGGTDAAMAPPVGYAQHVLLPLLQRHLGVTVSLRVLRRGYFPQGGGEVILSATGLPPGAFLPPLMLVERGNFTAITLRAFVSGRIPITAAQQMVSAAEKHLKEAGYGRQLQFVSECEVSPAVGSGAGIAITAETDTGCILGVACIKESGNSPAETAIVAVKQLVASLDAGACVDEWMQDQLIIFMALASGTSQIVCGELTLHTRTAIAVAQQLSSAKFTTRRLPTGAWLIECLGAGIIAGR